MGFTIYFTFLSNIGKGHNLHEYGYGMLHFNQGLFIPRTRCVTQAAINLQNSQDDPELSGADARAYTTITPWLHSLHC